MLRHFNIFLQYPKLETNSHSMLLHKSPDRQRSACGQRIASPVSHLIFVNFSSFVMLYYRQNFYTTDLFIALSRFVNIKLVLVFMFAFSKIAESLVIA